jgi:hypothetical protein
MLHTHTHTHMYIYASMMIIYIYIYHVLLGVAAIMLRLPDGRRLTRRFLASDTFKVFFSSSKSVSSSWSGLDTSLCVLVGLFCVLVGLFWLDTSLPRVRHLEGASVRLLGISLGLTDLLLLTN